MVIVERRMTTLKYKSLHKYPQLSADCLRCNIGPVCYLWGVSLVRKSLSGVFASVLQSSVYLYKQSKFYLILARSPKHLVLSVHRRKASASVHLDCKTVRIFAYSSTREQCEARVVRARNTLTPRFIDFFTDFEEKTDCFAVYGALKREEISLLVFSKSYWVANICS